MAAIVLAPSPIKDQNSVGFWTEFLADLDTAIEVMDTSSDLVVGTNTVTEFRNAVIAIRAAASDAI